MQIDLSEAGIGIMNDGGDNIDRQIVGGNIISLGSVCGVVQELENYNLQSHSYPEEIMQSDIPIVLTSDNHYAIPLYTAVVSALISKREDTHYQFILMVSDDFSKNIMCSLDRLLAERQCPPAQWIRMGQIYNTANINLSHITPATYYRLMIHKLISANKCLYLDVDVCVQKDLTELLETDLRDDYIAGVQAVGFFADEKTRVLHKKRLGYDVFDRYINCGVLLMNLKKMREDNIDGNFEILLDKCFLYQDQDVLNSACYPCIRLLPPKYNLMTKYNLCEEEYNRDESLRYCYSQIAWSEAINNPVIIHYADVKKPWMYPESTFATEWWNNFHKATQAVSDFVLWAEDLTAFFQLTQKRHILIENEINNNVEELRRSRSFRLGEAILLIPRKLRKMVCALKVICKSRKETR